jgi:lysophospholipase L1-like esterase
MGTILQSLRKTGFRGVLIVVNYYSPDPTNVLEAGLITSLNETLKKVASQNNAVLANAFAAFQNAGGNPCEAGLLNVNPLDATQMSCDVHPSQSGHQLLADTVEATYNAASPGH